MYNEKYWLDDLRVLYKNPLSFFPSKNNDIIENLNSIVRFGIYASILMSLYHKKGSYLFLSIIGFVVSYALFMYYDISLEKFDNELRNIKNSKYTLPSLNNPMMNVLLNEYQDNPNRNPAYPVSDTSKEAYLVKKDMEEKLNFNLIRDVSDIYNNKHNQGRFYTMPNTTIPSDLNKYLDYVYRKDTQPSCKENNFYCGKMGDELITTASSPYIFTYEENLKNLR